MAGRVQDKIAVITGAASGLGEATARMLAREGAKIVVADIDEGQGNSVAQAIGTEAVFLRLDVTLESDWEALFAATVEKFGRLDILVNCAGISRIGPPEDETLERWRALMAVNLDGVFLGTKHAIRTMKRNKPQGGSIVNLSSVEGLVGNPTLGSYNASKGGVRLYTKSVALYCAKSRLGIRVNSVHPAFIWTPMVENQMRDRGVENTEMARRALDFMHPIGHMGEPDDVAYGVLYLASDEAKFVTGTELIIDGGYTAQ
jgi:3(or 17)beta-hydroxysteroid dehydrogenase